MKTTYTTYGTCAKFIDIELEDEFVKEIRFIGGCAGNAKGVAALVRGMPVDDVIARLRGLECRSGTSCPDQLSQALAGIMEKQREKMSA
ncbi:MAG: TIGR03905 family TSCPD domain-containing protein [Desulfuromonadales bacterium]|nr:TIGR03905 family TSCPD domain-containing protein [Desulfuromonadales bacterium]